MLIQEPDFILEYENNFNKFNLSLLYVKNAKKEEKRSEEFKVYGYGMPLESCLNVIINYRIAKKKDVYTLKEYLEEYKYQTSLIANIRNQL